MLARNMFFPALCALILLLNCGEKSPNAVTFSIGGAPNEVEFWETLVREFEQKTGVQVELIRQPTDTDQRRQGLIIPLKARKTDPDIFLMDVAWVAQFAASDWLTPLDDFLEHDTIMIDNFFEKVVNGADRYDGGMMALPVYVDGGLLYYRRDLLEQFGYPAPPDTWSELIDFSLTIQESLRKTNPDFYGFVWQGAQYEGLICNFIEFAASNKGGLIIEGDRVHLNLRENIEALDLMRRLIHDYRISPPSTFTEMQEEEARSYFQKGNALFERNWPYAWSLHQADNSPVRDEVGIAPLPHFESGASVSTLGGWHIGISKFSDRKKEAVTFLEFVVSYETQKKLALRLGWNPGRKDVYADRDILARLPHFSRLKQAFENAAPRPNLPYYTQISEVLQKYVNSALADEMSPEEALSRAEKEAQSLMDRYSR